MIIQISKDVIYIITYFCHFESRRTGKNLSEFNKFLTVWPALPATRLASCLLQAGGKALRNPVFNRQSMLFIDT